MLNLPLFHLITRTFDYADSTLVKELMHGMPIAGPIANTGVLVDRVRPAQTEFQDWKKTVPKRNTVNVDVIMKEQGSELSLECWRKTLEEVAAGWVSTPTPITEEDMATLPLTPRFARRERIGTDQEKTRLIDDFRASGVNETVSTTETDVPDTIDAALALATLYERLQKGLELNSFAVDFTHAYKNIPIPRDQSGIATIILAPPNGPPMKASLRTQPFGARRAPANWARITAFLRWALARLFNINLMVYVDDCFTVETRIWNIYNTGLILLSFFAGATVYYIRTIFSLPVSTVGSAFRVVREFFALLGLELEELKEKRPTSNIELLGARICFPKGKFPLPSPIRRHRPMRMSSDPSYLKGRSARLRPRK